MHDTKFPCGLNNNAHISLETEPLIYITALQPGQQPVSGGHPRTVKAMALHACDIVGAHARARDHHALTLANRNDQSHTLNC